MAAFVWSASWETVLSLCPLRPRLGGETVEEGEGAEAENEGGGGLTVGRKHICDNSYIKMGILFCRALQLFNINSQAY